MPLRIFDKENYTYEDYLNWTDDERREIIDGRVYDMGPAPTTRHQLISMRLSAQLFNSLEEKGCQVLPSPLDVRFPAGVKENDKIIDVVQPDIVVVCDKKKIDDNGCLGAPDFIAEIISPSSVKKTTSLSKSSMKIMESRNIGFYTLSTTSFTSIFSKTAHIAFA